MPRSEFVVLFWGDDTGKDQENGYCVYYVSSSDPKEASNDCILWPRSQLSGKALCCHLYGAYPLRKGEGRGGQEEEEQKEKVSAMLSVFNMGLEWCFDFARCCQNMHVFINNYLDEKR